MGRPIQVVEVLEATAGGTRRHLNEVVDAFSTPEFRVHIACAIRRDRTFAKDLEAWANRGHSVSILPMTRGPHPLLDPWCVARLRALLRRVPFDIVHLHSAKAGWIGRLAALRLGRPVVYTPHAFPFLQRVPTPLRHAYAAAEQLCAPLTDVLLAVSPAEGRLAVETGLFAPEQVRVLPNALDIDEFDRRIGVLRPIRRAPDARVFGLLGEIRAQKDPWTFVEAASRLRARGVPARFALLDQGPDLAKLKQRVKQQKLDSVVEFVKTKDSLDDLLRRIDVGVLPSLWEGLPYSALDVMAARRPLLASDLPVFQDLVGSIDTRLLFRAGNAEALADRMQLWSSLPPAEIQETGRRGRAVVQKQHDAGGWREDLRDLFRSLARR